MIFKLTVNHNSGRKLYFIDSYSPNNKVIFNQNADGTKTFSVTFADILFNEPEDVAILLDFYEKAHIRSVESYTADDQMFTDFNAQLYAAEKWKNILDPILQRLQLPDFQDIDFENLQLSELSILTMEKDSDILLYRLLEEIQKQFNF